MKRVLVVDDDLSTLSQLSVQLGGHHDVLLAKSGEQALAICQQDPPDLVLLDVTMPGMDGFDTIAALKQELLLERLPVIFATATRDAAVEVRALQSGAVDFILKPLQKDILLHRIALHSRLFGYQRQMEQTVQNLEDAVISSFSSMMEYRGEDVSGHIARIVRYTVVLGEALRSMGTFSSELSAHTLGLIVRAVPLHDVGKIGVSDVIWSKPGMLSDEEFAVMKSHTTIGARMLRNMYARTPRPCLEYAILVAESHHERYDGTGYPNGLAGDDIPLCARMMAVMDTFDALINTRAYRGAMGHVDALRIVCAGAGTLFDPRIIEAFQSVRAELADIIQESRAGNRVQ